MFFNAHTHSRRNVMDARTISIWILSIEQQRKKRAHGLVWRTRRKRVVIGWIFGTDNAEEQHESCVLWMTVTLTPNSIAFQRIRKKILLGFLYGTKTANPQFAFSRQILILIHSIENELSCAVLSIYGLLSSCARLAPVRRLLVVYRTKLLFVV